MFLSSLYSFVGVLGWGSKLWSSVVYEVVSCRGGDIGDLLFVLLLFRSMLKIVVMV